MLIEPKGHCFAGKSYNVVTSELCSFMLWGCGKKIENLHRSLEEFFDFSIDKKPGTPGNITVFPNSNITMHYRHRTLLL